MIIVKALGLLCIALLVLIMIINTVDGGKPAVPYEARQGVDPDWPKKRDAYLARYCENPKHKNTTYCESKNGN